MKFEIIAGREFTADFTVVSSDGVTGEVLDPTDTATFTVTTKGLNPTTVLDSVPMTITDINNGLFTVTLTPVQTALLEQEIGFKEDRYPTISNYDGVVDFKLASKDRAATIDIFVKEI